MKAVIYILAILFPALTFGQDTKEIEPIIGKSFKITIEEQKDWERAWKLLNEINDFTANYDSISEKDRNLIDKLEIGEGPIAEWGDTWNSVAYPYKLTVSSELKGDNQVNYKKENLSDNNLLTAWIPENTNSGIGEKINFYFKTNNPRVNTITIFNGYMKNQKLWIENSRVKTIKISVNGADFAILRLQDSPTSQSFHFKPLQNKDKDLIITLEITEIYNGKKWNDTAISEITFDGLDVF
ncbi:hypothetical protein TRIP_D200014 [uncultured Paludibacter sp.]|uniref:NAD glycohydrolase translocation F5/8 type C domain-containing protein n=1 Tax=uncultured Paludibacter sp. TaxID=497635 RepID=A0A653A6S4_9BACT|nr:hypothetical protein TRIP_D200014 [uncultured Paludibacter sp.]